MMDALPEHADGGCQKCGEIARKIDVLFSVETDGDLFLVCKFCSDSRWWECAAGKILIQCLA